MLLCPAFRGEGDNPAHNVAHAVWLTVFQAFQLIHYHGNQAGIRELDRLVLGHVGEMTCLIAVQEIRAGEEERASSDRHKTRCHSSLPSTRFVRDKYCRVLLRSPARPGTPR